MLFRSKKLVSAETATWLGNHFKVSIAQVKPVLDQVFVGGVNHIFFHGATYSPPEIAWPGWLFYASTNFNPQSHFWEAMPALNKYIENVQTMLQANPTDSDALLYFPMEDIWHQNNGTGKLHTLELHANSREWLKNTSFGHWAGLLQEKGFSVEVQDSIWKEDLPPLTVIRQSPDGEPIRRDQRLAPHADDPRLQPSAPVIPARKQRITRRRTNPRR